MLSVQDYRNGFDSTADQIGNKDLNLSTNFKRIFGQSQAIDQLPVRFFEPAPAKDQKLTRSDQNSEISLAFSDSQYPSLILRDAKKSEYKFAILDDDDLGLPRDI